MDLLWNQVRYQKSFPKPQIKQSNNSISWVSILRIARWGAKFVCKTYKSTGIAVQCNRCITECFKQNLCVDDASTDCQMNIVCAIKGRWSAQWMRRFGFQFAVCTFQCGVILKEMAVNLFIAEMAWRSLRRTAAIIACTIADGFEVATFVTL